MPRSPTENATVSCHSLHSDHYRVLGYHPLPQAISFSEHLSPARRALGLASEDGEESWEWIPASAWVVVARWWCVGSCKGTRKGCLPIGMVLTEWKLVRDGESPEAKVIQALDQAATYSSGSLAGYELESERYLIVVGRKPLRVSELIRKGGILYQVMRLILDPPTPLRRL